MEPAATRSSCSAVKRWTDECSSRSCSRSRGRGRVNRRGSLPVRRNRRTRRSGRGRRRIPDRCAAPGAPGCGCSGASGRGSPRRRRRWVRDRWRRADRAGTRPLPAPREVPFRKQHQGGGAELGDAGEQGGQQFRVRESGRSLPHEPAVLTAVLQQRRGPPAAGTACPQQAYGIAAPRQQPEPVSALVKVLGRDVRPLRSVGCAFRIHDQTKHGVPFLLVSRAWKSEMSSGFRGMQKSG